MANTAGRTFARTVLGFAAGLALLTAGALGSHAANESKPAPAAAAAAAAAAESGETWVKRCSKDEKDKNAKEYCEVFQRLVMKEGGKRFMEFAVGYPEAKDAETARGVLVLPLGIMVSEDMAMDVDGKSSFTFKLRSCQADGCYAFLKLAPSVLETMSKGKQINVLFMSATGQKISAQMSLDGFGKALKKVKG